MFLDAGSRPSCLSVVALRTVASLTLFCFVLVVLLCLLSSSPSWLVGAFFVVFFWRCLSYFCFFSDMFFGGSFSCCSSRLIMLLWMRVLFRFVFSFLTLRSGLPLLLSPRWHLGLAVSHQVSTAAGVRGLPSGA